MSADSVNQRLETLREGDQAIVYALSELDTRLAAWVTAMEQGQSLIARGLELKSAGVAVEAEVSAPVVAELVEAASSAAEPETAEREEDVAAVEFEESASGMFQVPKRDHTATESAENEAGAELGEFGVEDDETLLAQLDEETAKIIRVKRRLCNNQRSVRELLVEYQREERPAKGQAQQRKQWWRLGNERQGG